jgi:hypothetical protein
MELIIAIVIVALGVAVWFSCKKPEGPVVEAETFSDNGIKFTAKEEIPAPVVPEPTAKETKPVKKPRAKKPAVVAKTATTAKTTRKPKKTA